MATYEVALIHKDLEGIKTKPFIVLNVDAANDEEAALEARTLAERHRPQDANAFVLLHGFRPIFEDWLDVDRSRWVDDPR